MARGFTRTSVGFRAWIRVRSRRDDFNELRTKRFPIGTPASEIRDWREKTRRVLAQQLNERRQARALAGYDTQNSFRSDARAYLESVRSMTTFKERQRDIDYWIEEFGDRPRGTIQPHEIRAVRERWLTVGPKRRLRKVNGRAQWLVVTQSLAASTVNHRLRALSNLWTVLDGRHKPNPVREVPEADEPLAVPRALDYDTIRRIIAAMPDRGRGKKDEKRPLDSYAKTRARVLAWTGITPKELERVRKEDIQWAERLLEVSPRRKGRGAPGRLLPLSQDAVAALLEFDRLNAYGHFAKRGVLRAWQTACKKVLGRAVRLYDLRHSFVTGVVRATRNLTTAQLLAGHQDHRTTQRYALAAVLPTLRAGMDAFTDSIAKKEQ